MNSGEPPRSIDQLLDQAFQAISRGDRAGANELAEQVLALDQTNADAEDLLAAPADRGEIRRLTVMFVDLVDSTALSTQIEPEVYHAVVGRYRRDVISIIERYEGHLGTTAGDGVLAYFGHPHAHEDDVRRAVQAGLDITHEVESLSSKVQRRFGFGISVRVGIHHGVVYLDIAEDDVYGLGANLASRICSLAAPGAVAVSETVARLVRGAFDLQEQPPEEVKGIDGPIPTFRVVGELDIRRSQPTELIGRDAEIECLQRNWAAAREGNLGVPGVLLRADAGLGKTRLAWAAVDMAERSHAVVLSLIGSPFHTDVGLRPVRRLLERRCGIGRTSDPAESLQLLAQEVDTQLPGRPDLIPLLAPVLGITTGYQPVAAEGRKLYEQIVAAVLEYIRACVQDTPALVLAEDVHWFDEDTVELLQTLLGADLGGHVMVVFTSRKPVELPNVARAEVFDLKPLTDIEADHLIVSLFPEASMDERRAIRRRGDGIPLYIEEIVAKVRERPADEPTAAEVPDTLYEALFARLRTSTSAVRVAEAAAIAGSRFDRHLLHAVLDLSPEDIDTAIDQLEAGRVLRPLDQHSWGFRHELLREVAAELSPPSARHRLHSRFADALTSSTEGNPDWPLIAQHYANAERFGEAATAYGSASVLARQRGALGESRTYLTHAIAQIELAAPGRERDRQETGLRLERGRLAYAAEGASSVNAARDYERCMELNKAELHGDELFATLTSMYGYYAMRADLSHVETLLESLLLNMTGRDWFNPFNEAGFGMLAWYRGQFGRARAHLETAAAEATDEGAAALERMWFMPNEAKASVFTHLALARYVQGDLAGADAELDRTAARCAELAFPQGPFSAAYALQMATLIHLDAGRLDQAAAAATTLCEIGETHGFDSWILVGGAQLGFVAAMGALDTASTEELDQHIASLSGILDMWRALGVISLITSYEAMIARLELAAGYAMRAAERLDAALQLARDTEMHYHDAELLRLRSRTHDDLERRHSDLQEAIAVAREQDGPIYELRCAIDTFELVGESARPALLAALERFPDGTAWPDLDRAQTLLR